MKTGRRITQRRGKMDWRKVSAAVVAMVLVVAMVIGLWPSNALELQAKSADVVTADSWMQSLGEDVSTQYAGRVWTDKSVYSEDTSFELYAPEGEEHPIAKVELNEDEDFLVAYSALATAQAVSGQTQAPVDVVFVVDISGSMDDSMQATDGSSSTRIAETVKALNSAIDSLMEMNKHTRVGVVLFSSQASEILPLGHYEKGSRTVSQGWGQSTTITDYFSLSGTALHMHVRPVTGYDANGDAITGTQLNDDRTVTGGTNIQKGIHMGMDMLATEESTTVEVNGQTLQRYPSVVLLSDGAPTYSSSSTEWWNPANNYSDGPGSGSYYGNGMKTLMTGAYMKDAINRNYGLTNGTTFYTIGMGITGLGNNDQQLAYMTLNPGQYWEDLDTSGTIPAGTYQSGIDFDYDASQNNTGISSFSCTRIVIDEDGNAQARFSIRRSNMAQNISSVTVNGTTYPVTAGANRTYTVTVPIELDTETDITVTKANNSTVDYSINVSLDLSNDLSMAESISQAWAEYAKGNDPTVDTDNNETYTFTHPSQNDILGTYKYQVLENDKLVQKEGNALQALVNSYYDANDATSINEVFKQIVTNIALNTAQVPTALQTGKPLDSTGWIIYEDPIGEYMEIKENGLKQIIYGGHQFSLKNIQPGHEKYPTGITVPENTKVYIADAHLRNPSNTDTKIDSGVYAGSDAADIIVMIQEKTENGLKKQTLYVYIPASTIPVRINTVTLKTAIDANGQEYEYVADHTNNGTYPVRVVYGVGLQDEVVKTVRTAEGNVEVINTEKVSADYLAKHTNHVDGSVNFYSNYYDGKNTDTLLDGKTYTAGNAKVTFVPAATNPFYFLQENTPIYTDPECTIPASASTLLDDNATYYYEDTYYYLKDEVTTSLVRTGAQLKNSGVVEIDGVWHRRGGTPRLNRIVALVSPKTANSTNTAELFYAPQYDRDHSVQGSTTGHMTVWLGNNGLLTKQGSGVMEISKNVTADAGLSAPIPEKGFEFTVTFENDTNTYTYEVLDTATREVLEGKGGTIASGGKLYLKGGETARIIGLVYDTEYVVTETPVAGYEVTPAQASGTIAVGEIAKADFTNHYRVEDVTWPANGGLRGTKQLDGRSWHADDTFTFLLTPFNNAPLPGGVSEQLAKTVTGQDVEGTTKEQSFSFGQFTFTEPGVYRYTIAEKEPVANTEIPGISYSRALYRLVVTVEDNHAGSLVVTKTDIQKLYDNDGTQLFTYVDGELVVNDDAQDEILFVNRYSTDSVTKVPVAVKDYTDKSGQRPLVSGMFEFKLTPHGIKTGNTVDTSTEAIAKVPMPLVGGQKVTEVVTTNEGINITFSPIVFTQEDLGEDYSAITYQYKVEEIKGNIPGMNYTSEAQYIDVTLSIEDHVLVVRASYETLEGDPQDRRPTFVNVYEPAAAEATLQGQKTLIGRDMKDSEEFTFNIKESDTFTENNAAPKEGEGWESTTVNGGKNNVAESFDFGKWTFKMPGTYRFAISEAVEKRESGVTYDEHVANVVVVIEDNNGQLQVSSITYDNSTATNAGAAAITDRAAFVNTYKATFTGAAVSLDGLKNLTGQTLEAQEFRFGYTTDIDATTGKAKANATWHYVTNQTGKDDDKDGTYTGAITFLKDVTYTEAGTYTYIIGEYIPENPILGMDNDETVYKLVVQVTDDGDGNLFVGDSKEDANDGMILYRSINYRESNQPTWTPMTANEEVVFNNLYTPVPAIRLGTLMTKVLEGNRPSGIKEGEFTFKRTVISATTPGGIVLMKDNDTEADQQNDIVKTDAGGTFAFGPMKFTQAGTYVVQIEEIIPTDAEYDAVMEAKVKDGVYYTAKPTTATIVVEDDQRGTLTVRIANVTGNTFVNTYKSEGVVSLLLRKDFTGRKDNDSTNLENWLDSDKFTFTVSAADTATEAAVTAGDIVIPSSEVTIDKTTPNRQIEWDDIEIYKAGTYTLVIAEKRDADIAGVTYAAPRQIKITATDEGNGRITATYDMLDTSATLQEAPIVFENRYEKESTTLSGHTNLVIHKDFTGRVDDNPDNLDNWLDADAFTFKLVANMNHSATVAAMGSNKIEIAENASESTVTVTKENVHHAHFDAITFHQEGTFEFIVSEVIPSGADANRTLNGITYTNATKIVRVQVTDSGSGYLVATRIDQNELTFTNTYKAEAGSLASTYLEVEKVFEGRDWNGDEFKFALKADGAHTESAVASGDIVIPTSEITITKNDKDANDKYVKAFDAITFRKTGTYAFEITEIKPDDANENIEYDTHRAIVTVTVYDDGIGQLVVGNPLSQDNPKPAYTGSLTFTNIYVPDEKEISLNGKKEIVGRDITENDEFVFTIEVADNSPSNTPLPSMTIVESKGENIAFGPIVFGTDKTKEAGYAAGTYRYIIRESRGADGVKGITTDKGYVIATVEVEYDETSGQYDIKTPTYEKKDPVGQETEFTFVNTYHTSGVLKGETNLKVTKNFTGRANNAWLDGDVFTFKLAVDPEHQQTVDAVRNQEIQLPTELILKVDKNNKANAYFGDITFTKEGTYQFVVTEDPGSEEQRIPGVLYDGKTKTVIVNTVDKSDGTLAVTLTSSVDALTFTNMYEAKSTTATLEGKKKINGRDLVATDIFEFEIEAKGNAPWQGETVVKNDTDGKITFASITFTKAGIYVYEITEKASNVTGVTDATDKVTATVTVEDNNTGELKVTGIEYSKADANGFVYTNQYTTTETDEVTIDGKKLVSPTAGNNYTMVGEEFTFEIAPYANNPGNDPIVKKEVKNAADGSIRFAEDVVYKQAGTYKYTVREISGKVGGIGYDDTEYIVTVEVVDDTTNAKLKATVTYATENASAEKIEFNNSYNPTEASVIPFGKKVLDSEHIQLAADKFQFKLEAIGDNAASAPMPESGKEMATNDGSGNFQFGKITYKAVGEYTYQITEVNAGEKGYTYDDTKYTITVKVTDEAGVLVADVTGLEKQDDTAAIVFTNGYTPDSVTLEGDTALGGKKNLSGREMKAGEFTFQLIDKDNQVVAEDKNDANGSFKLEPVTFTKAGTYYYTIVEKNTELGGVTYDETVYTVKVEVTDAGGHLEADVTYLKDGKAADVVFENVYKAQAVGIQISAAKALTGRELKAGEFTFLLKNASGEVVAKATNDANGLIVFEEIKYDKAGTYEYTISEEKGNAEHVTYDDKVYKVTVTVTDDLAGVMKAEVDYHGANPAFNNSYEEPQSVIPTGDFAGVFPVMMMAIAAGVIAVTLKKRREAK